MSSEREKLHEITALQQFNGSFGLDTRLCQTIGVDFSQMTRAASSRNWNTNAFATVLALAYFHKKLSSADVREDWEMIANKSKTWLVNNHRAHADDMFDSALKLV